MRSDYVIRQARAKDLTFIAEIELSAARLLSGYAPQSVLVETTSFQELEDAQINGRLWVALKGDVPIGFAHVEILDDGVAHLEEIDVHPEHGRRGIGTRLVRAVCQWASSKGNESVTLTTFRDVPWNMPFYVRLGFEEIPQAEFTPALISIIQDETDRGLNPTRRVAMRWRAKPVSTELTS